MISFATVTSIDDAEFNSLFSASLPDMDAGSFPWRIHGQLTDIEKRDKLRADYEQLLSEGFVWRVSDDDGVLMLNAGIQNGTSANWILGLVGTNAAGSKSYLYSQEYVDARNAYWASIGITGWTLEASGANTPVHNHMVSRQNANALGASMTTQERVFSPELTFTDITLG